MFTHREAYIYGWVFGLVERAIEEKSKHGIGGITHPSAWPVKANVRAIEAAHREKVAKQLEADLVAAFAEVRPNDVAGEANNVLPGDLQGSWLLGYHHAKAGMPLPPPPETLNIEERRKALGLSQGQLAELVGVTQAMVSRWESGQAKPTAENKEKLIEVLKAEK